MQTQTLTRKKGLRLDDLSNPVAEIHSAQSSAAVVFLIIIILL